MRRITIALLLLLSLTASAKNLYIPVAGRTAGANDTYWRTDVRIFNPSATRDLPVSLHFLPQGLDGSNIPGRIVTVPKRQMLVLNDIVGTLFEMESAVGAIRLDSDTELSYAFTAESRTYTNAAAGTYGQFIPAIDVADAKQNTIVTHVAHNANTRTNAGVMNPSYAEAHVTASLVKYDGTLMMPETTIAIPPKSMLQRDLVTLFGLDRNLDDGFILFQSDVPVITWASIVDNRSGDPFCVMGVEDKDEVTPLP